MREPGAGTPWLTTPLRVAARLLLTFAAVFAALLPIGASARKTSTPSSVKGIPGLPTGVPPAATTKPPTLPTPSQSQWPFPSAFSHTEGTGRLDGGASLWTDFVYDDHGPAGSPAGIYAASKVSDLAPVHGGFTYPSGDAHQNGADIFTAAVGYTPQATYWRVDWNTLVNPDIPVAEWTIAGDSASGAPAPATAWPGNSGLTTSTGIQYALIVTAKGAHLVPAANPSHTVASFPTTVNMASRSFIVKIPTSTLPVSGTWRLQLAAGLANSAGDGFATVPLTDGATGNGVNVYNVTFRTYRQEAEEVCPTGPFPDPGLAQLTAQGIGVDGVTYDHLPATECGNFWMENDQANTLSGGNVSKYSLSVNWSQLQHKLTTPQPLPTGYTNRWYVTPLHLGQGVADAASGTYTGPTYLGRVQPYAVYVPTGYNRAQPTKLTWILHSLGANLNQYGGVAPSQLKEECQDRNSICATTEAFSEGQWYYADAEVDFWDVWHQLALTYHLAPNKTVMSGYSMGGWASYKLPEEYPDLFAQSMPLEGPVICGLRVYGQVQGAAGAGQCTSDGDSTPQIVNLKWIPYVMTYGGIDELVPFTGGQEQISRFRSLGYRFYAVDYPTEDHMVFSVQNDFTPADSQLDNLSRPLNPGSFTFKWYPNLVGTIGGIGKAGRIGPTGDYWMSGLAGRATGPGKFATLTADSSAIRQTKEKPSESYGVAAVPEPTPAVIDKQVWKPIGTTTVRQLLTLSFSNVGRAAVDTVRARLKCATVRAKTDGSTALTLLRLRKADRVTSGGRTVAIAHNGKATVHLSKGTTTLHLCSVLAARAHRAVRGRGTHRRASAPGFTG
jgi:predicted esterase